MLDLIKFGKKYEKILVPHGAGLKDELMLQYAQILFQMNLKHRMLEKIKERSEKISDIRRYEGRWRENGRNELMQHPRVTDFDILTRPFITGLSIEPKTKALLRSLTLKGDVSQSDVLTRLKAKILVTMHEIECLKIQISDKEQDSVLHYSEKVD